MLTTGRAIFRTLGLQSRRAGGGDGSRTLRMVGRADLKRQAFHSWSEIQDTYMSTKQGFESNRAVFTIGTSILSVLTAWAGYSILPVHQTNVEKKLGSMEEAMEKNSNVEEETKKIVSSGNVRTAAIATAGASLIIVYSLGWYSGSRFALRNFQRGQITPNRWQFYGGPYVRPRSPGTVNNNADLPLSGNSASQPFKHTNKVYHQIRSWISVNIYK